MLTYFEVCIKENKFNSHHKHAKESSQKTKRKTLPGNITQTNQRIRPLWTKVEEEIWFVHHQSPPQTKLNAI